MNIPKDLIPDCEGAELETFFADAKAILKEIVEEFQSGEFGHRLHRSDATYIDGCRGPMCKLAHREAGRRGVGTVQPRAYWQIIEPLIIFFGDCVAKELEWQAADDALRTARNRQIVLESFEEAANRPLIKA